MSRTILYILLIFAVLGAAGCYYDNEEELYPNGGACNLENITYSGTVLPVLQDRCYKCHSTNNNLGGGIILEGYENLKIQVDNGRLLGAIKHQSGFSPMPKNEPKLLDCTIQKIEKWITDGALDN